MHLGTHAPRALASTFATSVTVSLTMSLMMSLTAPFLLGGCAVAPREPVPGRAAAEAAAELDREVFGVALPAPPRDTAASVVPALAIDRWWVHFNDPALNTLIEGALTRNADLGIAAARLREARAQLDEARGAQSPTLDLQASSGRARASADSLGGSPGETSSGRGHTGSAHKVALAAQYEVDLWGRLAAGTDAARARLASQAWAHAAIEWGLSAQLAEVHFSLRTMQRQREIAEAVRLGREQTVALRRTGHAAGVGSEFELRRAEAELASAETTLAGLQRQQLALESARALLAGTPLAQLAAAPSADVPLDPAAAFEARLPQGDMATLLLRRPDLRQAEARLAATRADIGAARAATLPALRLSGSVGSDVRELSNLFNGPGFAWALAASAAQSLFDGGRAGARIEQAQARSDAALLAYRQSVATALAELREAYAAFDTAERALAAERRRVAALAQAMRLARLGHEAGVLPQIDALDAERSHFQAQLAEVDTYRDRLLGQVAAFKALGGGHAADHQVGGGDAAPEHGGGGGAPPPPGSGGPPP
ncbi:MAG: efflux transporter outer membrane subunit, partial [Rubrivivax sp.]|nr:efflux transporter outer membrane subunit [Rubrivivax sp.]